MGQAFALLNELYFSCWAVSAGGRQLCFKIEFSSQLLTFVVCTTVKEAKLWDIKLWMNLVIVPFIKLFSETLK